MRTSDSPRSTNPTKSGRLNGRLIPSKLGVVILKTDDGKVKIHIANRHDRRHGRV